MTTTIDTITIDQFIEAAVPVLGDIYFGGNPSPRTVNQLTLMANIAYFKAASTLPGRSPENEVALAIWDQFSGGDLAQEAAREIFKNLGIPATENRTTD